MTTIRTHASNPFEFVGKILATPFALVGGTVAFGVNKAVEGIGHVAGDKTVVKNAKNGQKEADKLFNQGVRFATDTFEDVGAVVVGTAKTLDQGAKTLKKNDPEFYERFHNGMGGN